MEKSDVPTHTSTHTHTIICGPLISTESGLLIDIDIHDDVTPGRVKPGTGKPGKVRHK